MYLISCSVRFRTAAGLMRPRPFFWAGTGVFGPLGGALPLETLLVRWRPNLPRAGAEGVPLSRLSGVLVGSFRFNSSKAHMHA